MLCLQIFFDTHFPDSVTIISTSQYFREMNYPLPVEFESEKKAFTAFFNEQSQK